MDERGVLPGYRGAQRMAPRPTAGKDAAPTAARNAEAQPDTIFLRDLRVTTVVGIWEWEKRMPQVVSIDLDMSADIRGAAETDSIADTLDYKSVSKRIKAFVAESRFNLIETMSEQIAGIVLSEFNVRWVRVAVHKPFAIRGSRDVGISIERGSRQ